MPDRNGLSLWAERTAADFQLRATLQAFERAFLAASREVSARTLDPLNFPDTEKWVQVLQDQHGIRTIEQLAEQCRSDLAAHEHNNIHLNHGTPANDNKKPDILFWTDNQQHAKTLLQSLSAFLPSPLGFACRQLAEEAVRRVETGQAKAQYIHRGSTRGEKWVIGGAGKTLDLKRLAKLAEEQEDVDEDNDPLQQAEDNHPHEMNPCWQLDVDCAGYVRNVIKSVTGSELLISLSDRDYMRAKDFFTFFERLEYTVKDIDRLAINNLINPADDDDNDNDKTTTDDNTNNNNNNKQLQWCRVDDLKSIIAGDIIVYRAKGGAAGGSVFTKKDTLYKALTAVKTAELYDAVDEETGLDQPVDINVSKLPEVKEWVDDVMAILQSIGIEEIDQLRGDNGGENDEDNDDNLQTAINLLEQEGKLSENTVSLLQEVLSSTNGNTGHIMFAAGPAEETSQETHIWRIPVYHSTGVGPKSKRGIQRAYKRFEYSPKYETWTRGGPRDDVEGGHIEVVVGRIVL